MSHKIPLHYQIADKVMELVKQGTHRKTIQERLSDGAIELIPIQELSFQPGNEIFISSADIYSGLSIGAIKLVIRIQQELVMNNPLWECTDKNLSRIRSALAQLKKAGIVDPIDGTNLFLINPTKIRKGRPLSVYGALYEYSKRMYEQDKKWKPTNEDIKRLRPPDRILLSMS